MTIKMNNNMSKIQRELVVFMEKFKITNLLAAKLLKCSKYAICRYRKGHNGFTKELLKKLKCKYKEYMQKKLDSIKV